MTERVYYTGFLAADRYGNNELDELAAMLLVRADRGEIILLQRRLSFGVYEYIAVESAYGRGDTNTPLAPVTRQGSFDDPRHPHREKR
jgi:hypothetical protein